MKKQRMIKMLKDATAAVGEAAITANYDAKANLIGQLILASAIEGSGESISMSLDKLEKVAMELGDVATAIRNGG